MTYLNKVIQKVKSSSEVCLSFQQKSLNFLFTSSPDEGHRQFPVRNQQSGMDHVEWLVVCRHDLIVSDQLVEREEENMELI